MNRQIEVIDMVNTKRFSWKGWKLKPFLKGRKKLIIAGLGYLGGWIITRDPAMSGIVAGGTELVVACIEYYIKA